MSILSRILSFLALLALAACSSGPKAPDWQMEAKTAMERAVAAYLEGNSRVEAQEFARARSELSSTGRSDLMARAELLRCASRVASLVLEPCAGFEVLRPDAPAAERAYADYLAGQLQPQDLALLPAPQRGAAAAGADAAALKAMADPLSQLVAAGVMFRAGRASPAVLQQAVDTASGQGWRRPLLAWLGVQLQLAEKGGDTEAAAHLRRRIALTQNPAAVGKP
ncbi:hypothetical protein [Polaromonas sp.]|uniref:hypothetical protein n=1 Tax=Polaromonas sp. TaxID=1869339 RepID=UPI0024875351|nr:hypothetical protein [Polaromonas sp.]MDI1275283.1 hypothetical protein [Polaromonas sp.]